MPYKINIRLGSRADCQDGFDLRDATADIIHEIEDLSRLLNLSGDDITLEFSEGLKRGAVAFQETDTGKKERDYSYDGYDCPKERFKLEDNCPVEWRKENSRRLFDLIEEIENREIFLECFSLFAETVRRLNGFVNIDDVEKYIMFPNMDRKGQNWVNMLREEYAKNNLDSEEYEMLLENMQTTFALLSATTSSTLGSYRHSKRTITIYDDTIRRMYPTCYKEAMLATYAHELFHCVHRDLITNYNTSRAEERIVLESLASCFEYIFCERKASFGSSFGYNYIANRLYNQWDLYDIMKWPYSGAIAMVDLEYVPVGSDYFFFSRTYRKSIRDMAKSYGDAINAYATHQGRSLIGTSGTGHSYHPWPVGEYFRTKNNRGLQVLYTELINEFKRSEPSVFDDTVYSKAYIRIRDNSVTKNRTHTIAVVKFETKANRLRIDTNKPRFGPSRFVFTPTKDPNLPYCFYINSIADVVEAARILQDSLIQMR